MSTESSHPARLSLAECRRAAKEMRRAERGRQAYNTVRPRGTLGVIRGRAPLTLILYLAAAEARLVWRNQQSFALLEAPTAIRPSPFGNLRLSAARLADRHWDMLVYLVPPIILFLPGLGLALAIVVGVDSRILTWPALVAILLIVLAMLYFAAMMIIQLVWATGWLLLRLRRRRPDRLAAESLPAGQWTMTLFHSADPEQAEELLRQVSERLNRLVTGRARAAAQEAGAVPTGAQVLEVLLCLTSGITTDAVRAWLPQAQRVGLPYGISADVVTLDPTGRGATFRPREFNRAKFLFWYVGGCAAWLATMPLYVADEEAKLCETSSCAGRPATYGSALRWLTHRLLFSDPADLHPASPRLELLSWTVGFMGLMVVPVFALALRQQRAAMRRARRAMTQHVNDVLRRSRVLVLVATLGERDAALDVARSKYGREPVREMRSHHAVFRLDVISDTEVMLVHVPGPVNSPSGLAASLPDLIQDCQPDFVVLTGTCFGLRPEEQKLTDVLVVNQARDLDHQARVDGPDGTEVQERGLRQAPSSLLLSAFTAASSDWSVAKVHAGPMIASGTLYNSKDEIEELRRRHPNALGGDMESHHLYTAAARSGVNCISVRGISDWGHQKTDQHRYVAASNAADYVFHTIRSGLLRQPDNQRLGQARTTAGSREAR